jgi:hypothetical protein
MVLNALFDVLINTICCLHPLHVVSAVFSFLAAAAISFIWIVLSEIFPVRAPDATLAALTGCENILGYYEMAFCLCNPLRGELLLLICFSY